jgi:hypothetical protein
MDNGSYVNSLEEKIRMLESRMNNGEANTGPSAAESQDQNGMDYTHESTTINDFPLSPTSVKDIFELEDSQSLEVLEFGISYYSISNIRWRISLLSGKRLGLHAGDR